MQMATRQTRTSGAVVTASPHQQTRSQSSTSSSQQSLTQSQNPTVAPLLNSSNSERRKVRIHYRELIHEVKDDAVETNATLLMRKIEKANQLFSQVNRPREAALDAKFLKKTSAAALKPAQDINFHLKNFSIKNFLTKLNECEFNDPENEVALWKNSGLFFLTQSKTAPSTSFLYGATVAEAVQKQTKQRAQKEALDPKVVAQTLKANELEPTSEQETSKRVGVLHQELLRNGKMSFFRFICDPTSFSQTIKNMFHVSFLIKEGRAAIKKDPNTGEITVEPSKPPGNQERDRKQCVVCLNYKDWKDLIQKMNISSAVLRQSTILSMMGSKPQTEPQGTGNEGDVEDEKDNDQDEQEEAEEIKEEEELELLRRKRSRTSSNSKGKEVLFTIQDSDEDEDDGDGDGDEEELSTSRRKRSRQ